MNILMKYKRFFGLLQMQKMHFPPLTSKYNLAKFFVVAISKLGKARGCSTNTCVLKLIILSLRDPLLPQGSWRRQAQTVLVGASSHYLDYAAQV